MSDVVVVGGGVIGMLSARMLAQRGASVTLLESGSLGAEASWAGGGIISALTPWDAHDAITRLILWGHHYYPSLAQDLKAETGIDVEWNRCGMLLAPADVDRATRWSRFSGLKVDVLEAAQLVSLLPVFNGVYSNDLDASVFMPEVAQIRNPRLIKALERSLSALDVTVSEHTPVKGLQIKKQRVTGVETAAGAIAADKVVVAAGAWAADLMPELARKQIAPVRGEMLLYQTEPGFLTNIIVGKDCYLVPRRDGQVLCGSTVDNVGFNSVTTKVAMKSLSDAAERLLPSLKNASIVGQWAGLRPGSDNGVPVIGRSLRYDSLYVNCGHFRNGIGMAPASAQLVCDLVEGVKSEFDECDYALS